MSGDNFVPIQDAGLSLHRQYPLPSTGKPDAKILFDQYQERLFLEAVDSDMGRLYVNIDVMSEVKNASRVGLTFNGTTLNDGAVVLLLNNDIFDGVWLARPTAWVRHPLFTNGLRINQVFFVKQNQNAVMVLGNVGSPLAFRTFGFADADSIGFCAPSVAVNDVLLHHLPLRTMRVLKNWAGCRAATLTAPTANTIFTVYCIRNSIHESVGTITFTANSLTGVFSATDGFQVDATEAMYIKCTAGGTALKNVSVCLATYYQ